MPEEESREISLEDLKARAMVQIRNMSKHDKTRQGFVKSTTSFLDFMKTESCDNLVVATIYYVSSSLFLTVGRGELEGDMEIIQSKIQEQSKQVISSLYCQILLSPMSGSFRVREERIFYETLIFFLDACACYAVRYEPPAVVYELIAGVFRKDIPDPNARRQVPFLPITEIVRRNWLSQSIPGKNRSTISHSTLRGNTDLVGAMVNKRLDVVDEHSPWDENGFPEDCIVPFRDKVLDRETFYAMPPPKSLNEPGLSGVIPPSTPSPKDVS
jgi:hypothetical protein